MASSCEEDSFHVFTNSCFIEIDKTNKMGEVIVTSLLYKQVPIIRYRLGDCAEWITDSNNCCRLSKLPRIKLWGVRTNDYFINKDNKEIAPFVITDSITLICSSFKCTIDKYKVCQISESLIRYYFEQILVDKIQIKNYLTSYLANFFGSDIVIEVFDGVDYASMFSVEQKFKYIERKFSNEMDLP